MVSRILSGKSKYVIAGFFVSAWTRPAHRAEEQALRLAMGAALFLFFFGGSSFGEEAFRSRTLKLRRASGCAMIESLQHTRKEQSQYGSRI